MIAKAGILLFFLVVLSSIPLAISLLLKSSYKTTKRLLYLVIIAVSFVQAGLWGDDVFG
jgi:hypothetical protein